MGTKPHTPSLAVGLEILCAPKGLWNESVNFEETRIEGMEERDVFIQA